MPSEQEVLTRIRQLEGNLGIKQNFISEADVMAKIQAKQQRLASMPMSLDEFVEKRRADSTRGFGESASAFGGGVWEGVKGLGSEGVEAVKDVPWYWYTVGGALYDYDTLGDLLNVGARDFTRFAKSLGGSIRDEFGYTTQEEAAREYKRYRENFDYYQKVRPAMLEHTDPEMRSIVSFGANFIDPFMVFPVAKGGSFALQTTLKAGQKGLTASAYALRQGARAGGGAGFKSKLAIGTANTLKSTQKGLQKLERGVDIVGRVGTYPTEMASRLTSKFLRKGVKGTAYLAGTGLRGVGRVGQVTAFTASLPRKAVEKTAKAISRKAENASGLAVGGQLVGGLTGSVPMAMELGITEGIGLIAKKVGLGFGEVLKTLGQPGGNKRFLYRLATNSKVSPGTRRKAMWAYNHFGTAIGDGLFNSLANGLSIGAINASLAGLAGEDAEATGAAFGGGFLAGGVMPTGQRGMKAGKTDFARDTKTIDDHMRTRLTEDQRTSFKKMPRQAQVMLSTLQESGIGSPKFMIVEPKAYLEMLNSSRREQNLPELDRAPKGHYDKGSRTIYINEKNLPESSKVATELVAHETGHDFVYRSIGDDPAMLQLLLESYKTTEDKGTPFHFNFDKKGNPIGDPIYLDDRAVAITRDYDMKQRGRPAASEDVAKGLAQREGEMIGGIQIGRDASKLAQEVGAEQFAMMFTKNPNAFDNFHPRMRRYLIDASRKLLSVLGVVERESGNPLSNPISKAQLDNPILRRIYENYGKARGIELDEKGQLAKKGMLIEPKRGQSGEERFVELFGGNGLSLSEAKNLRISNKTLRREIDSIKKRYKENPEDGWSVTKRGFLVGKKLTDDLRTIFTRNDPFGNVATILDALQQAIDKRMGIIFGYRSGTKTKRQNQFRIRDVGIYGYQISAGTLKVLGYDQSVVRQNVQTLVEKGYVKNIKDFEQKLAEQGQQALADPEGRINPEGRKENEIMTVAFGLKESIGEVASPGLKELLDSGAIKKSFRSYDIEALAGLRRGNKEAFSFDYENIRNNYNPFRQSEQLFMPEDGNSVSDSRPNEVMREAMKKDQMFMPALSDAVTLVEQQGRVAENAEDAFFGIFMPKILKKTEGQLKPSVRNIREASRRAIDDVIPFLRDHPQFADYYNADMAKTRNELDNAYANFSDDDFLYYRTMLGLTSPGTKLPSNVGDGVNLINLYKEKGNLDDIVMGKSAKGNVVIKSSPFNISGATNPTKARSLLVVDKLRKRFGSVRKAIDYLEEGIPVRELHKFNREMGYAGSVGGIGNIQRIVKQATGQDKLIPRMMIFGPKVGAYTLNAIGNHNYNTIDVWEARFIRSYFKGMFDKNTGLPADVDEHALFTRFTEVFQEEFKNKTGKDMETSALQASRWFYMIDTAKKLGYSGASTNETISHYTNRYVTKLRANSPSRGQGDGSPNEGVRPQAQEAQGQSKATPKVEALMP